MEWLAGGCASIAALFFVLYQRALSENRNLVHLKLMILLGPEVYDIQRRGLESFVLKHPAQNANDLGAATYLASRMELGPAGVAGLLWKLKTESGATV